MYVVSNVEAITCTCDLSLFQRCIHWVCWILSDLVYFTFSLAQTTTNVSPVWQMLHAATKQRIATRKNVRVFKHSGNSTASKSHLLSDVTATFDLMLRIH